MKHTIKFILAVLLVSITVNTTGQIKLPPIKKKAETQVNDRANQRSDEGISKGIDAVENKLKGVFKKKDGGNQSQTEQQDQGNQEGQQSEGVSQNQDVQTGVQEQTQSETYSKYDFIPGEKIIFFDDFSQDAVGDFPALWNTNGSAEVVNTNLFPGNWMRFVMNECVWTDALLQLPDNYTIEFDVIPIGGLEGAGMSGWNMKLMQAKNVKAWDGGSAPGQGGFNFKVEYFGRPSYSTWLYGTECEQLKLGGYVEGDQFKEKINQKHRIAIWDQKSESLLPGSERLLIFLKLSYRLCKT